MANLIEIAEHFTINNIRTTCNYNFNVLLQKLVVEHLHNGENSAKISHINLNDIGVNSHSAIDTAISDLTNHISNTSLHGQGSHQLLDDRDDTATSADPEDHSHLASAIWHTAAGRTVEESLNATGADAHDATTGRVVKATSPATTDCRHTAEAIFDETEETDLQTSVDAKLKTSNLGTAINALEAGTIDGNTIETASETTKGAVKLGSEGGAATFNHTHNFSDDAIKSGKYFGPIGGGPGTQVYVDDRLEAINAGSFLKNEVLNGVFTFAGYDGSNNTHALGQAVATYNKKTGIPGWHVDGSSSTNFIARVKTSDFGTPTWGDIDSTTLRHRGRHGNAVLELHSTGWDTVQRNIIYSDVMCLDSTKPYTLFFSHRNTVAQVNLAIVEIQCWDGNVWHRITDVGSGNAWCFDADTNWHSHKFYCAPGYKFVRLRFELAKIEGSGIDPCDLQLARIGFFEGNWESDAHIPPDAWYSPHIDYHSFIKSSLSADTLPTPDETWVEWNAYKKTYYANLEVTPLWAGTGTLPLPKFNFIYNVKITPSYVSALAVPTTPPTNVPIWYSYWSQGGAFNFDGSSNSITVAFPAPPTGSEYVTIEVDYWPANIADADLP